MHGRVNGIAAPRRRHSSNPLASQSAASAAALTFRQRFDDLENRRDRLIARLSTLGEQARQHPAHRRALSLLNVSFRRASLSQRGSVLQAAEWLIEVLERLTVML